MNRIVRLIRRILALSLVILLNIESFAAVVSDNDGSAFITKAEFDSIKNDFQAQIDNYNTSIDAKIDGAIAAYLAGVKLTTKNKYKTIFGDKTTNPYYIYKDAKSALVPFYYSDAGLDILCAMSYGLNQTYATAVGLTLKYDGEPLIGVLYGSWPGNTTVKINPTYYSSLQPTLSFSYSANSGMYCAGGWGLNVGYLRTEWTLSNYRAGNTGSANVVVNGSKTDKHVYDGIWHFGSDDSHKSTNILNWKDIPTWASIFTFCGGSGHSTSSNGDWKWLNGNSSKASFSVSSSTALIPLINSSRGASSIVRVQDRIKTAPSKSYISKAAYNMTKSVTGDTSNNTTRKDRPRDPLWCRFSYWPRVNFQTNAGWSALSSNADRANSAVIPVDNLNSDTLISDFTVGDTIYPIKVWSGCPLYKIDHESKECEFDITLNKSWDSGSDVKFKLYIQTSKEGFTKQQLTDNYTENYLVDGVQNNAENWITAGKHTIKLTTGAKKDDLIWLSWKTDVDGDGGKLVACSDMVDCTVEN